MAFAIRRWQWHNQTIVLVCETGFLFRKLYNLLTGVLYWTLLCLECGDEELELLLQDLI